MNLLSFKSAPIASLCDSDQAQVGRGAPRRGGNNVDGRRARQFWLARNARHAQGKIVVPAGCAAQARGSPAGYAGLPCRSQDSQNKTAMGRTLLEVTMAGSFIVMTVQRCGLQMPGHAWFSVRGRRQDAGATWWAQSARHGARWTAVPAAWSRCAVSDAPSVPGSRMRPAATTCLGAPRRARRPHARLAGHARFSRQSGGLPAVIGRPVSIRGSVRAAHRALSAQRRDCVHGGGRYRSRVDHRRVLRRTGLRGRLAGLTRRIALFPCAQPAR